MRRFPFEVLIYVVLAAIGVHAFGSVHAYWHDAVTGALGALATHSDVSMAGPGLQVILGQATAPSTTLTAVTLGSGDALSVQNCPLDKLPKLIALWGDWQTSGYAQLISTKFSDAVNGIKYKGVASQVTPLWPLGTYEVLTPNDLLVGKISGSGTAGDIESMVALVYYPELPGVNARLLTYDQFVQRATGIVKPVENQLTAGSSGGYSGQAAINAFEDYLQANTDYAIMGYQVDVEVACVGWRGADTGNLRVGGPGNPNLKHLTGDWFLRLAKATGLPLIPVFNQANRGSLLVDVATDENGGSPKINTSLMALTKAA